MTGNGCQETCIDRLIRYSGATSWNNRHNLYWIQNWNAGSNQIISVLFALSHCAQHWWLDPKPAPLAVFAAQFSSAENPPKKRLHVHDNHQFTFAYVVNLWCSLYTRQNTCLLCSWLLLTDSSFYVIVLCAIFQCISAENVGSQPYFSRIFYLSR